MDLHARLGGYRLAAANRPRPFMSWPGTDPRIPLAAVEAEFGCVAAAADIEPFFFEPAYRVGFHFGIKPGPILPVAIGACFLGPAPTDDYQEPKFRVCQERLIFYD